MDGESEIEHRGAFRQLDQLTGRREHVNLVLVQVHLEILHEVERVAPFRFQGGAYVVHELVEAAFRFHAFIFPVGGEAPFGYLVHPACAYLYFHPLVLRPHHGDVQALVAIALRNGYPVLHAFGIRLVHIGNDGVDLPAFRALPLQRRVEDDPDGEQVVDALEFHNVKPASVSFCLIGAINSAM